MPIVVIAALAVSNVIAAETTSTEDENTILSLLLKRTFEDGGYMVVAPLTDFSHFTGDVTNQINFCKMSVTKRLGTNAAVDTTFVDRFLSATKSQSA